MNRLVSVDRGTDLHTHSNLTDGADSPEQMADAAEAAHLTTWGLSDHVRADSTWVADYERRVHGLRREGVDIRCGVEAKILDRTGRLDLPPRLPRLDYVLIADHQFPGEDGPVSPREMTRRLLAREIPAAAVVDGLVGASCAAVAAAPIPAVVVHLFSLLPKIGLSEADVTDEHLTALARACRTHGAAVEINEKWRCPSSATLDHLAGADVVLVAGSDAHRCADVGVWCYLDEVSPRGSYGQADARRAVILPR